MGSKAQVTDAEMRMGDQLRNHCRQCNARTSVHPTSRSALTPAAATVLLRSFNLASNGSIAYIHQLQHLLRSSSSLHALVLTELFSLAYSDEGEDGLVVLSLTVEDAGLSRTGFGVAALPQRANVAYTVATAAACERRAVGLDWDNETANHCNDARGAEVVLMRLSGS